MLIEFKSRLILEFETNTITRKEMKNMNKPNNETSITFDICYIQNRFSKIFLRRIHPKLIQQSLILLIPRFF